MKQPDRSPVIDADSHWTVPWEFRLDEGPLRHWASKFPGEAGELAFFLAADALRDMSSEMRPTTEQLFPVRRDASGQSTCLPPQFAADRATVRVADRLAWMDNVGIDFALVNGPGFPSMFPLLEEQADRRRFLRESNELLRDLTREGRERLSMVTYADLSDIDTAIEELTLARQGGSRAFSIRAEPVNGLSLGHPHFDRLWSAVIDLGMVVSVHIGLAPSQFGAWANLGIDFSEPGGVARFLRHANSQRHQGAESLLCALLFGGVFHRHPRLTVVLAELFVFWLPSFVRKMDMMSIAGTILGDWPYESSPGEMLRNCVRASPLPGLGDVTAMDVVEELPGMIVFSSDYPHAEGNADPIELYGPKLNHLEPSLRQSFLGGSMAECFTRTGDPLTYAAS